MKKIKYLFKDITFCTLFAGILTFIIMQFTYQKDFFQSIIEEIKKYSLFFSLFFGPLILS